MSLILFMAFVEMIIQSRTLDGKKPAAVGRAADLRRSSQIAVNGRKSAALAA
jgi:hypothetical protein